MRFILACVWYLRPGLCTDIRSRASRSDVSSFSLSSLLSPRYIRACIAITHTGPTPFCHVPTTLRMEIPVPSVRHVDRFEVCNGPLRGNGDRKRWRETIGNGKNVSFPRVLRSSRSRVINIPSRAWQTKKRLQKKTAFSLNLPSANINVDVLI